MPKLLRLNQITMHKAMLFLACKSVMQRLLHS